MFHYPHCPIIIIKYNVYVLLVVYSISKYHQISILTISSFNAYPLKMFGDMFPYYCFDSTLCLGKLEPAQ